MPPSHRASNGQGGYVLDFEKPMVGLDRQIAELQAVQERTGRDHHREIRQLRAQYLQLLRKTYRNLSRWETVQVARHPARPQSADYIGRVVKEFVELHGDRAYGDDRAIRCGLGRVTTEKVAVIAHQKGRETREKIECNFGYAHPEGYRKALRVMRLAEKFRLPVVCLIDTPGAYPGVGSEQRGVAEAIATNLQEMSRLRTPIVCVIIGEGGSGGALGIGVGDHLAMLAHSYYSVIAPEGCAAILWKTGENAAEAAEALKLTARDLLELDLIDEIIPEPLGGAHRNPAEAAALLERAIVAALRSLRRLHADDLLSRRYQRWRRMGKTTSPKLQHALDQ
jgi:acetyl-CoA carboxylase carboxyl transferase subunit alpha